MPKTKQYRVTVEVSGDIELLINATSEKRALEIAEKTADNMSVNGDVYLGTAIENVDDATEFQVNEDSLEEIED